MIILPVEKQINWSTPPVVLALLVLMNSFIYLFYQLDDQTNLDNAIQSYGDSGLLKIEYNIYLDYLRDTDALDVANDMEDAYYNKEGQYLISSILHDLAFRDYLEGNIAELIYSEKYADWLESRKKVNSEVNKLSYFRFGLIPERLQVVNLFSHQFMHGSFMHLFGNMVFLIMCGFVVEAAIGHLRFLLFYLASGVGGGLLHSVADFSSYTPLVGASGAISGVMAMYLAVFKLKKIEFFYWFFAFVGYFKAPALILLPIYIAMELIQYFSPGDVGVAFLAHVGGFATGAILIGLFLLLGDKVIDEKYIEDDQSIDPFQEQLNGIYKPLERYDIHRSLEKINSFLSDHKNNISMSLLQIKLQESLQQDPAAQKNTHKMVLAFFSRPGVSKTHLDEMSDLFKQYQAVIESNYSSQQLSQLGISFCRLDDISLAEKIFENLLEDKSPPESLLNSLGVFSRRLAHRAEKNKDGIKKNKYNQLADKWLDASTINLAQQGK